MVNLEKARLIENQGAKGGIVIDNSPGTTANGNPLFAMSGDGTDDVRLTNIFYYYIECPLTTLGQPRANVMYKIIFCFLG